MLIKLILDKFPQFDFINIIILLVLLISFKSSVVSENKCFFILAEFIFIFLNLHCFLEIYANLFYKISLFFEDTSFIILFSLFKFSLSKVEFIFFVNSLFLLFLK